MRVGRTKHISDARGLELVRSLIREHESQIGLQSVGASDTGTASANQMDRKVAPPQLLSLIGESASQEECRRIPRLSKMGSGCALSHAEILDICRSYAVGFPLLQSIDWRKQGRRLPNDDESATCVQLDTPIGDGKVTVYYSGCIVVAGKDSALGVALVKDWTALNPRPPKKSKKAKVSSA